MKKIIYFIIFMFVLGTSTLVQASEDSQNNSIKKAILIETYIKKHKTRIEQFIKKYNIKDLSYLEDDIKELNESIKALNKIKTSEIPINDSDEIIKAILKRIKSVNENLKKQLSIEKNKFENNLKKKKYIYSKLWIKISNKIDNINIKIVKTILIKNKTTKLKESNIRNHLIKLNKESKKLKYFWKINFKSEKEIKDSFVRILNNIKREVNLMKKTLN